MSGGIGVSGERQAGGARLRSAAWWSRTRAWGRLARTGGGLPRRVWQSLTSAAHAAAPVTSTVGWGRVTALVLPTLGLAAVGMVTLCHVVDMRRADVARSASMLRSEALHAVEAQSGVLAAADAAVAGLSWGEIRTSPGVKLTLARLTATSDAIETLSLVDPDGRVAATGDGAAPPPADLSDRDYVRAFHQRAAPPALFVSAPSIGSDDRLVIHLARPRTGLDPAPGGFDGGLVVTATSPETFERSFEVFADGVGARATLLRADGTLLARVPRRLTPGEATQLGDDEAAWALVRAATTGGSAAGALTTVEGSLLRGLRVNAAAALPGTGLVVLVQGDPTLVLHEWLAEMAFSTLGALSVMALLLTLAARARRETRLERDRVALRQVAAQALQHTSQQRAEFETRLRQTEKAAALGQLAAGVAHDFNNLLHAVLLGTDGLQRVAGAAPASAELRRSVRLIERSAERGVALTRRMLDFARRDDAVDSAGFDPGPALGRAFELLTHSFGQLWSVTLTLPPETLPPVAGDSATFETVVINLAVNARDAMPRGGRIELVAEVEHGHMGAARLSGAPAVRVVVRDGGVGMDAATLARAGEAFFTTKPVGAGTGLGLSMARGFAQRVGGVLEIASEPGVGTTVTLRLPVAA